MFEFIYWDITGSIPFDLAFSVISFFAISGFIFKSVIGLLVGRKW